jgi:sugar phosphate permease
MKWKVSNTLWVVAVFLFLVGVLFNWEQSKKSINNGLAKARAMKKKKAEEKKKQAMKEETDNTTSPTNGVIKEDGVVKLEEIEIIKSKV